MKLSKEINLLIIGSMLIVGALCAGGSIYSLHQNSRTEREHLRELLLSERKKNLRDLVSGAYSVLSTANFYEPAQNALTEMRFGENNRNYFFVIDTDAMFWVYPVQPELVGKVKKEMVDVDGLPYIKQLIEDAQTSGEGFIRYKEIPQGEETAQTRLVHYKYFEKWKWIVCAGMYITDIEHVLAQKEGEIQSTMLNQLIMISILMVVALLISTIISARLISKRVVKPLLTIKNAAEKIGQGDFTNTTEVTGGLEIRQLAKSLQSMQISLDKSLKMTKKMMEKQKVRNLHSPSQTTPHQNATKSEPTKKQSSELAIAS